MAKIETIVFGARDPEAQRRFYCDVLGMSGGQDGTVGYGGREACLHFTKARYPYAAASNDLYWKIALAVPNIELACRQLSERGVSVGEPRQFRDVGYLAHFADPEGFAIELIEHWFQGNRPDDAVDPDLLGGGAHLNLLTLRTTDIEHVKKACTAWGMTPLSIQPVTSHGFTLYFFAFTDDVPPNPYLYAVENREWLYQRPYSVLEVQHIHGLDEVSHSQADHAGYLRAEFSGLEGSADIDALRIKAVP